MSAEDPYRWAQVLFAGGQKADAVKATLIGGGVDASLADEVVASIVRNRPRVDLLKVGFGLVLLAGSAASVLVIFVPPLTAVFLAGSLFMIWDGIRGR